MTRSDLAEIKGELFSIKALLFAVVDGMAGMSADPVKYLETLQKSLIPKIKEAAPVFVTHPHIETFEKAAIGVLAQVTEAAKAGHEDQPKFDA